MTNFIERIKSYSKRKDAADMAIRAWKSDNKKVYADFVSAWMLWLKVICLF